MFKVNLFPIQLSESKFLKHVHVPFYWNIFYALAKYYNYMKTEFKEFKSEFAPHAYFTQSHLTRMSEYP